MRPRLALAVAPVALVLVLSACGGGGESGAPAYGGPTNVIVFSAKEANGTYALYSITPETGAEPERLTTEPQAISYPRWSPDGARIAYVTGDGTTAAVRVIELASSKVSTVSESAAAGAAWSPGAKELAYIDPAGGGTVHFYNVESGDATGAENIPGTEVDWSSNGDLAVVADGNLIRVDPDSGDGELLADEPEAIYGPRWSPDGDSVAFSSGQGPQLFVVRPGGEPANLGRGSQPAWTADSARLAFAYAAEAQTGVSDIYTVDVTPAAGPEQLSTSITLDQWPSWSPDGTRVAYVAAADRATAFVCIAQFGEPGGDCLQLPNGLLPMSLAWSPK